MPVNLKARSLFPFWVGAVIPRKLRYLALPNCLFSKRPRYLAQRLKTMPISLTHHFLAGLKGRGGQSGPEDRCMIPSLPCCLAPFQSKPRCVGAAAGWTPLCSKCSQSGHFQGASHACQMPGLKGHTISYLLGHSQTWDTSLKEGMISTFWFLQCFTQQDPRGMWQLIKKYCVPLNPSQFGCVLLLCFQKCSSLLLLWWTVQLKTLPSFWWMLFIAVSSSFDECFHKNR